LACGSFAQEAGRLGVARRAGHGRGPLANARTPTPSLFGRSSAGLGLGDGKSIGVPLTARSSPRGIDPCSPSAPTSSPQGRSDSVDPEKTSRHHRRRGEVYTLAATCARPEARRDPSRPSRRPCSQRTSRVTAPAGSPSLALQSRPVSALAGRAVGACGGQPCAAEEPTMTRSAGGERSAIEKTGYGLGAAVADLRLRRVVP
jgi:hypothetical protein